MAALQPVRGTRDILPAEGRLFRHVEETGRTIARRYGYDEVSTPIFEFSEVFRRTLGDTSDIVTKEMYSFTDKGGDEVTLRPEGTACIARMLISGGLMQDLPLKLFYSGPMFRYERPQKGRFRQFHQIGVELLGVAEPVGDVEIMALGAQVLDALGVLGHTQLELNTLGNDASRTVYRKVLVEYLSDHSERLSDDSVERLKSNPLRVLDSKDKGDRAVIEGAPNFGDSLDQESEDFFAQVRTGLDALELAYVINPRLVRGLDYYCHTAFEFTTSALGAQGTVLAGGRYDGLVAQMGGNPTPGVGWAAGIERLSLLLEDLPEQPRPVAVVPVGAETESEALKLAQRLRAAGFNVEIGYRGNVGRRMKRANRLNATAAVIVGPDELARGAVTLRDLDSGDQDEVPIDEMLKRLNSYR